ncbi:MAG: FHA domain-containing protein [Lachnospiraceae bacterium]|nr:FHA domain-containing protein [Lachnospiraceae bacterium]
MEIKQKNGFSYIEDEKSFNSADYMALKGQEDTMFVKCMKMKLNGKTEVLYFTDGLYSLDEYSQRVNNDEICSIIKSIIVSFLKVKENGFLKCEHIDVSSERIFVDSGNLKVRLTYKPFDIHESSESEDIEKRLKGELLGVIDRRRELLEGDLSFIYDSLKEEKADLDSICKNVGMTDGIVKKSFILRTEDLSLVSLNTAKPMEYKLNKEFMVLGKKSEFCDIVLDFNNAISRKHCSIRKVNNEYMIKDENSANGTFVNGERLAEGEIRVIQKGDIIKLANSDFKVV